MICKSSTSAPRLFRGGITARMTTVVGLILVGLSLLPSTSACPDVQTFTSVEVAPYMGLWYVELLVLSTLKLLAVLLVLVATCFLGFSVSSWFGLHMSSMQWVFGFMVAQVRDRNKPC
jgi:hypothetical protein